jgi:hypothetical protein
VLCGFVAPRAAFLTKGPGCFEETNSPSTKSASGESRMEKMDDFLAQLLDQMEQDESTQPTRDALLENLYSALVDPRLEKSWGEEALRTLWPRCSLGFSKGRVGNERIQLS